MFDLRGESIFMHLIMGGKYMHYRVGVAIFKCMQIVLIKRVMYLENILYQLLQVVLLFLLDYKGVG